MKHPPVILLGDSCTGTDTPHAANLEKVVARSLALIDQHSIDAGIFLGDQIMGYCDADILHRQWRDFSTGPITALSARLAHYKQLASNHVCFDDASAAIFEQFCGAPDWNAKIGDVQYIAINTAFPSRHGDAGIDCDALEHRLQQADPARPIVVVGHHPIWPVNGYDRAPLWVVPQQEGKRAWEAMLGHGVSAYICSHIIAFDVQLHDGMVQLCTGGAGTQYGPGGAMPGHIEGLHVVLMHGPDNQQLSIERIPVDDGVHERWHLRRSGSGWVPVFETVEDFDVAQAIGYHVSLCQTNLWGEPVRFFAEPEGPPVLEFMADAGGISLLVTIEPGGNPALWRYDIGGIWHSARIIVLKQGGPGGVIISIDDGAFHSMRSGSACGLRHIRKIDCGTRNHSHLVSYIVQPETLMAIGWADRVDPGSSQPNFAAESRCADFG